jgi:hypothetical protein
MQMTSDMLHEIQLTNDILDTWCVVRNTNDKWHVNYLSGVLHKM